MFSARRLSVFALDIVLIALAYCLALYITVDLNPADFPSEAFSHTITYVVLIKAALFLTSNLYRSIWKYASLQDALEIFKTVSLASIVTGLGLVFFREADHLSHVVFMVDWGVLMALILGSRFVWRLYRERYVLTSFDTGTSDGSRRTLIVGAGDAGNMLLREIRRAAKRHYDVVGFVDDDKGKHGLRIGNVPIRGAVEALPHLVKRHDIENVIIAMPSADGDVVRRVIRICERAKVKVKILPALGDVINEHVTVAQIKDVEIHDLLGRDQVNLDKRAIASYLDGRTILVSGAAGSIGSEIVRQVAEFAPRKLVLLDSAESPLFFVEREICQLHPEIMVIPVICDIRNVERLSCLFQEHAPEVVFHAAAYKHVPLMEYNPVEAITNNIIGTRHLADTAHRFKVANFVMISTDKAVNPTNVMGASKRTAEMYVQALAGKSSTRFTTVRFGNVLGSNGSVIPIFMDQIRRGGPITVTDRRVTRYFMTIPEATQLVLQAGCLGKGGDIFVLDMGKPVRILELAEQLIRLSGLVPYEDIDISFTGLRPGEKLYEELLLEGEGVRHTVHEKISVLSPVQYDYDLVAGAIDNLRGAAERNDIAAVITLLTAFVTEYQPADHYLRGSVPANFVRMRPDMFH